MNRGLGGAGAGDDVEMIEQAIDRQQDGIKRAGNNAVNRAINAARTHNQHQSESEISASSEEESRVPRSISRASMAAVQRTKVHYYLFGCMYVRAARANIDNALPTCE